jgi:dipeptidase D
MNILNLPSALAGLQPELVWRYFAAIAAIPHGSGNEAALADYVCRLAAAAGYACKRDSAGNVCLYVPPSPGCENSPVIVLQGHLDMVCEKNDDLDFDFMRSGLELVQDNGWIRANGTTLGADNGIGMAAALAAAFTPGIAHGPLEILLTADEERGLKGAMDFAPSWLSGRILLNLDSEKTGAVCIGCAGGGRVTVRLPLSRKPVPASHAAVAVRISGLRGGHSGLNIHENRGNAVKLLAGLLNTVRSMDISLCSLTGGDKHNAIPREAAAVVSLPWSQIEQLRMRLDTAYGALARGCQQEPAMMMSSTEIEPQQEAASCGHLSRMLDVLLALPSGVLAMSTDIPGLVETSCNLAAACMQDSMLHIDLMPRSSQILGLDAVTAQIQAIAGLAGGSCSSETPYPGWEPRLNSPLLHCVEMVHQKLFGVTPRLEATHAGLECGIIGQKCPGMDMLSFGPDIADCHSPAEKVLISSVEKFWLLLCGVLEYIAKKGIA